MCNKMNRKGFKYNVASSTTGEEHISIYDPNTFNRTTISSNEKIEENKF